MSKVNGKWPASVTSDNASIGGLMRREIVFLVVSGFSQLSPLPFGNASFIQREATCNTSGADKAGGHLHMPRRKPGYSLRKRQRWIFYLHFCADGFALQGTSSI